MRWMMLLMAVLMLTACGTSGVTVVPTGTVKTIALASLTSASTSIDTVTPTALPIATQSPTPTFTPTATVIPEALKEEILQAYKVLLFIQIDANLLNETMTRVQSSKSGGFNSLGALIATAASVQAVDESIADTFPLICFNLNG